MAKRRKRLGVFCLEAEWRNNYKRPTTLRPAFELLASAESVPFIHRNVATRQEFEHYVKLWLNKKYLDHPILYLGFHGNEGALLVGDQRREGRRVGLDELSGLINKRGKGRVIFFGSCSTLALHGNKINRFLRDTGLQGVMGYEKDIGWMDSAIMDIFLLTLLTAKKLTSRTITAAGKTARTKMKGISDDLSLRAISRPK